MSYYVLLFTTGIFAGFMNVAAGGGSLITLPILILSGMPPVVANGTNRIAVLIQNIVSSWNFHRHGRRDLKQGLFLGLAAVPGAVAGALTGMRLSDSAFKWILAGAILLGLSVIFFHRQSKAEGSKLKRKWLQAVLFLFIGFYGGLIQAGTGYLIIFSLSIIGGLKLAKTNSIKVIVIAVYLLPSIFIYAGKGNIQLVPGLILAAGNSIGGILGSNFSQKMNPKWIKAVLAVALAGVTVKLFFH